MSKIDVNNVSFVDKMWDLVNNAQLQEWIGWAENGKSFLIKDVDQFAKNVLPSYFKHSNYSSFVRQLNMYGFHKNKADLSVNEFSHKSFCRDAKHLLPNIRRKALQSSEQPNRTQQPRGLRVERVERPDSQTQNKLAQLKEENELLRGEALKYRQQRDNTLLKITKFLSSLSAELIKIELSLPTMQIRQPNQTLSMQTIQALLNHFKNQDQPFDFEVYQRYRDSLLYLVQHKARNQRPIGIIRENLIILSANKQQTE